MASPDRSWAELPSELLVSIIERLNVFDVFSFGKVCTSWSRAAQPWNNGRYLPLHSLMPYLFLCSDNGDRPISYTFFSNLGHQPRRLGPLPEMYNKWIIGSQHGWLAVLDEFSNPSLLNPLTRAEIQLPPISTLKGVVPLYDTDYFPSHYLYRHRKDWGVRVRYSLEEFRPLSIHKLVLSSSPTAGFYAAVAIFDVTRKLLFTRLGEDRWTYLKEHVFVDDVIYSGEGKFLVVDSKGKVSCIDPIDPPTCRDGPMAEAKSVDNWGPAEEENRFRLSCDMECRYLVELDGDVLQVLRKSRWMDNGYKRHQFEVLRIFNKEEEDEWLPVRSLGDKSLFLGISQSKAVSASDVDGLQPNCIYYTDDGWDVPTNGGVEQMTRSVEVYGLENSRLINRLNPRFKWPLPVWITPSLF